MGGFGNPPEQGAFFFVLIAGYSKKYYFCSKYE